MIDYAKPTVRVARAGAWIWFLAVIAGGLAGLGAGRFGWRPVCVGLTRGAPMLVDGAGEPSTHLFQFVAACLLAGATVGASTLAAGRAVRQGSLAAALVSAVLLATLAGAAGGFVRARDFVDAGPKQQWRYRTFAMVPIVDVPAVAVPFAGGAAGLLVGLAAAAVGRALRGGRPGLGAR
ncbi:MAG TPA: hypothetical protein VF796_03080 [Humisphaera sp.]